MSHFKSCWKILAIAILVAIGLPAGHEDRVAVYLPMSYQIGGFLVVVPKSAVQPLDMKVDEALRLAVTAGVSAEEAERP